MALSLVHRRRPNTLANVSSHETLITSSDRSGTNRCSAGEGDRCRLRVRQRFVHHAAAGTNSNGDTIGLDSWHDVYLHLHNTAQISVSGQYGRWRRLDLGSIMTTATVRDEAAHSISRIMDAVCEPSCIHNRCCVSWCGSSAHDAAGGFRFVTQPEPLCLPLNWLA